MIINEDDKNNNGSINNNATTNLKDQISSLTLFPTWTMAWQVQYQAQQGHPIKTNNHSIKPCSDCRNFIQWHTLDL